MINEVGDNLNIYIRLFREAFDNWNTEQTLEIGYWIIVEIEFKYTFNKRTDALDALYLDGKYFIVGFEVNSIMPGCVRESLFFS